MATSVSRDHSDTFLKRERQQIEQLRAEMGSEIVNKLDRVLLRDLISDRQEAQLADLFELKQQAEPVHEILINATSGRRPFTDAMPPVPETKRRARIAEMRTVGELATSRIEQDLEQDETEILDRFWLTHSVHARANARQIEKAASRGDIRSVNSVKRELATCLNNSRPLINADQVANNLGFNGAGITVAVVDTGIDATHPALAAAVTSQIDLTGLGNGDGFGHGTHCAGIVASQDRTFTGIAPGASLIAIRVMDNSGSMTAANGVAGLQAAVTAGARVASNSWGFSHGGHGGWSDSDGTCILCTAADNAVTAGVVVVVAAGNEDNDSSGGYDTHLRCPGMARTVVTVAASDKSDVMASFSSLGPTPDGRTKPDITAPGVSINSCRATGTTLGSVVDPAGNFISLSGTSMATPHIAGVAALMLNKNGSLTPAQVKGILMASVVNLGAPAISMGTGRIDALVAVNAVPTP
jgi:serine protease AprX